MAIIRKKELLMLSEEELEHKMKELKLEQLKLKVKKGQATTGTKKAKELKKTIARIYTQLNQSKGKT